MKLSIDFGRWTATKAALAVAGLLAIGGAVGSALAVGPTVPAPIKWQGGVASISSAEGSELLYNVPAGRNFMLTDLVVSNLSTSVALFSLRSGSTANCAGQASTKLKQVAVPPNGTVVIPFVTGFGFTAEQSVCFFSSGPLLQVNARGYLFTAAS